MAMNNGNYGYPSASSLPSSFSTPYSTPPNMRSQRPRVGFAYSSVPLYPRPRSSASKPNPDIYTESMNDSYGNSNTYIDSMRNNYGSPDVHMSESYASDPYNDNSLFSQNTSAYYSSNDTFYDSPKYSVNCGQDENFLNTPPVQQTTSLLESSPLMTTSLLNSAPQKQFSPNKFPNKNAYFGGNSGNEYKGNFQKKPFSKFTQNFKSDFSQSAKPFYPKSFGQGKKAPTSKFGQDKRQMATKSVCRCDLCGIDFTSNIPYEMHLRGAKHAKKVKTQDAISTIHMQGSSKDIPSVGKALRCDMCNVIANSAQQFQTHLDGTKHKNKIMQLQQPDGKAVPVQAQSNSKSQMNGKSNGGSTVRSLPMDFGEPQAAKMTKLACDICNISVNSHVQLQQHLISKKHQAKVDGKPLEKRKPKPKMDDMEQSDDGIQSSVAVAESTEATKTVVGVKTLSASFVQGGTLL